MFKNVLKSLYSSVVKRILDIVFASILLIVALLPMLIISLVIKLDSPGPVIFRQERIGKSGKVFWFYKFRSMVVNSEHTGTGVYSMKEDSRVTPVGRFLRASSLDELPQLINILLGDMSFIGPRPPLTYHPWEYSEYTSDQLHMFDVRPGITGWAQVNGRKCVEWNKRIELNCFYVDNCSFLFDCKILFLTVKTVLLGRDNENTGETVVK